LIGDQGAQSIAQMLHINSSLTSLKLSVNSISDTGAGALADALVSNQKLAYLDLY